MNFKTTKEMKEMSLEEITEYEALGSKACVKGMAYQKIHGDGMIKDITIKLGGTKQAKRQYESVRADIETTFTLPHETAMDTEKAMEAYKWELRRAKVLFKEALREAIEVIDGKVFPTHFTAKESHS